MGRAKAENPCRHTHANYDTMWRGQRITVRGCYLIVQDDQHFGYGKDRKIFGARCADCGIALPLGPSNDEPSEVQVEMRAAESLATGSTYFPDICDNVWDIGSGTLGFGDSEHIDAWPWDPTRPVAGQYEATLADTAEQEHQDMLSLHDYDPAGEFPDNLSTAADCLEHPGADGNDDGDCMECAAVADDMTEPLTVTIDNDSADNMLRAIAETVDPNDPTHIEVDGPLPSAACLDAMEYEITRDAEPDCRDEDGPEVERIMAEMEAEPDPAMKRHLDHEADAACRRVPSLTDAEAAECAALSDSDVCQACGDKWTAHGQTCSGSAAEVIRG